MSENTVTDTLGRKIEFRVLDPADMLDLLEAAGDQSTNTGFVRYASIVCSVKSIDGIACPVPSKKSHIKAAGRRLKNEGLVAVSRALFGGDEPETADGDEPTANPVVATAKN